MPYLICDKCNVSYEIRNISEMDSFHTCKCGNELQYFDTIEEYMNEGSKSSNIADNDPRGHKKGVFYSINKKNLVTLQMEMLRENEENEKKERLRRDLNYRINHAIAKNKEKQLKNNYEPMIIKEFGDKSLKKKKEMLLHEKDLLEESEEENVNVMGDLKKQINSDGLLVTVFGVIWMVSISYSFYLFLMAISIVFFGLMILVVSKKKYYSKSRLRWIYALNGISLAIFGITSVIFIILALFQGNYSLFVDPTHHNKFYTPPILIPILMAVFSSILSYFMFCRAALPDYPDEYPIDIDHVYNFYGPF